MGLVLRALCQILFFHGALQCYQARLEFSDQGFMDTDNSYSELNNQVDTQNRDLTNEPGDRIKDTNSNGLGNEEGDKEETIDFNEDAEENVRDRQQGRVESKVRRIKNQERVSTIHNNSPHYHSKGSEMLENPPEEEEIGDHDREVAHFYLTKPSDMANISVKLGPGPVSIQVIDPTTMKPSTSPPPVIGNRTKIGIDDIKNTANISSENDYSTLIAREHKSGHRKKLKLQNSGRRIKDVFVNWKDNFIPVKQPKKESSRMFHKKKLISLKNERGYADQPIGHRKRKHKKIHDEAINIRKDTEKYHLNEEEQYTNISVLNKSFLKAASKKFDMKNRDRIPNVDEPSLDKYEGIRMTVDKVSDEDAKKICLLNTEREISEEGHTSLRDEAAEIDKKIGNIGHRSNPRKGFRSKIEYGKWLDQVTLLPLPDYSINRTHHKKKLSSSVKGQEQLYKEDPTAKYNKHNSNKRDNRGTSVNMNGEEGSFLDEASKELNRGPESARVRSEYTSDSLETEGELTNRRNERDIKRGIIKNNFRSQRERNIFNRHSEASGEKGDEMYDEDVKQEENTYSNYKNNNDKKDSQDISENEEDYYEYDTHLRGDEKTATDGRIANITTLTTESTCATQTDIVLSIKSTRKPTTPRPTVKTNEKSESVGYSNGFDEKNKTTDPYEMFLCGQLADNFVDAVLKKVKMSRKISRELGYSNETDETCDRCIELKPIKLPEQAVMKASLAKCSKTNESIQNCSLCCGVPKPMARFLDALVYFEKENGNSFYNKIQDDSSFIFTGDYQESLMKGESSIKVKDNKYVDDSSSFHKSSFDKQLLRDDANEEKSDGNSAESMEKTKVKFSNVPQTNDDAITESIAAGKGKEMRGGLKRYLRRFGKNKMDGNRDETDQVFDENVKSDSLDIEFDQRNSPQSVKEYNYNKKLDSFTYPNREFGKNTKPFCDKHQKRIQNKFDAKQEAEKKPNRNFDRFYGKSNYDYFKQYPPKSSQVNAPSGYVFSSGDSPRNPLLKDNRESDGSYKLPNPNRMITANKHDDNLNYQGDNFGYFPKKNGYKTINSNENSKGYGSKDDFSYEYNGEYSLYPNLEGRRALEEDIDRISGNYRNNEGPNYARMVKRGADDTPEYDDEPNVFFEIPDIEYDLYK